MAKPAESKPPGLKNLDAVLTRALAASNKDVRAKMAAEKKARKRKKVR